MKKSKSWVAPVGRWTLADGEAVVAAYRASGKTQGAFANEHGIGAHRVSYWRTRVDKLARSKNRKRGFVPIEIVGPRPASAAGGDRLLELRLRDGQTLTLVGDWDGIRIRSSVVPS